MGVAPIFIAVQVCFWVLQIFGTFAVGLLDHAPAGELNHFLGRRNMAPEPLSVRPARGLRYAPSGYARSKYRFLWCLCSYKTIAISRYRLFME